MLFDLSHLPRYHLWANINALNQLRRSRGMTTFTFRPHSGEAGNSDHLAATFMLSDGINHGILLKQRPCLQVRATTNGHYSIRLVHRIGLII